MTGSALPTWKHLNTQSSLFTFKFFSTTQFKNVQSPQQAKLHLSRLFFKTANLKFKKKPPSYSQIYCPSQSSHILFLCTNKPDSAMRAPCQRIPTTSPFPDRAEVTLSQVQPYDCPICCVVVLLFNTENIWESIWSAYCRPFFIQTVMIKLLSCAISREEAGCLNNLICPGEHILRLYAMTCYY